MLYQKYNKPIGVHSEGMIIGDMIHRRRLFTNSRGIGMI